MTEFSSILVISGVAVVAPLMNRLAIFARMPRVALELLLGIMVGPSVAGLVAPDDTLNFLGELGLVYLFFQAGFEFKQKEIGLAPLRLGALAWLASFALSIAIVTLLYFLGLVRTPLLVALILPTTAFGVLIPVLRQTNDLHNSFGRHVLGSAAAGELGPLILASIVLAHEKHHLHQTFLSLMFLALAVGTVFALTNMRSERLSERILTLMNDGGILPVRIALLVLLAFIALASQFGMEIVVGAYTAGMAVSILVSGTKAEILEDHLMAIGTGFFVPLFFIKSGADFDLHSLYASPEHFARFLLFSLAFIFIRIAPLNIYKKALPERDLPALALLSSTTLPLVVAITYLGVQSGQMMPENASALVGAAIMTVTIFPTLAFWLRAQPAEATQSSALYALTRRIADWMSTQFDRAAARLPEEWRARL